MSDDDIKMLFDRIAHHFQGAEEGSQEMFSMLVKTALRYREMLMHSSAEPLSVGEVRQALDAFMLVLQTHEMPQGVDKRVHDLVILWLEELKERAQH